MLNTESGDGKLNNKNQSSTAHLEKYNKAPKSEDASLGHPDIGDIPEKKEGGDRDESATDNRLQDKKRSIANRFNIDRQKKLKNKKNGKINNLKTAIKRSKTQSTTKAVLKNKNNAIKILAGVGGCGCFTGILPILSILVIIVILIFKKIGIIKNN